MIEWPTPDYVFRIRDENVDLTQAINVYVTFVQGSYSCTKTGSDIQVSEKEVRVWLDQDESSVFKASNSKVEVQINWTYNRDGQTKIGRAATTIKSFQVTRNLLQKAIE